MSKDTIPSADLPSDEQQLKEALVKERLAKEKAEAREKSEREAKEKALARAETAEKSLEQERETREKLEESLENPNFFGFLQNNTVNNIMDSNFKKSYTDPITRVTTYKKEDFILRMKSTFDNLPVFSKQFFLFLLVAYTNSDKSDTTITFPLSQYMEIRGLKDKKSAKEKIIESMTILNEVNFSSRDTLIFPDNKTKKVEKYHNFSNIAICSGTFGVHYGKVYFQFNEAFLHFLTNSMTFYTDVPSEIFKLNTKTSSIAFESLYYIILNYRENEGKDRCCTISVKTLISKCNSLPTYEEVMNSSKHVFKLIIAPLIHNLDQLESIGYSFLTPDNEIIENPDLFFKGNSDLFFNCKLSITYDGFPSHPERLSSKQKRNQKAISESKKNKNS